MDATKPMDATEALLRRHARQYPQMEPCDAVKLLFQHCFGGGHMVADAQSAQQRLQAEYATVAQRRDIPLFEDIGGGLARLQLAAMDVNGLSCEEAARRFLACANAVRGNKPAFLTGLSVLRCLAAEDIFSFSAAELEAYLVSYRAAGYPVVSHSRRYHDAYHPAYRVVFLPREQMARQALGQTVTVTVDRPLGSRHPQHPSLLYPINYGYTEAVLAPDGAPQDAYILGVSTPLQAFTGRVIAVLHRADDVEDKWVAAPDGCAFTDADILRAVQFQEQYFHTVLWR